MSNEKANDLKDANVIPPYVSLAQGNTLEPSCGEDFWIFDPTPSPIAYAILRKPLKLALPTLLVHKAKCAVQKQRSGDGGAYMAGNYFADFLGAKVAGIRMGAKPPRELLPI